ncbi:hypothetical protein BJ944DRAFT_272625 [Cunninghamella echinulata]|nr:hypothetical protein BJ944DRAFT_272625 [Cunninghamella echinulata]
MFSISRFIFLGISLFSIFSIHPIQIEFHKSIYKCICIYFLFFFYFHKYAVILIAMCCCCFSFYFFLSF